MANADYTLRNRVFGFCPNAILAEEIEPLSTSVLMSGYSSPFPNGIRVGMAAMIGTGRNAEIIVIEALTGNILTVGRGCCDTVPRPHQAGSVIWFFDDSIGRDTTEYGSTEVIGVKVLPRTLTGGQVPIENSPPKQLTMSSRFARPYPPGNVRVNGNPFVDVHVLSDAATPLVLTWAHRDRVTQADLLVKHGEATIGPEVGTTYTVEVLNSTGTVIKTVTGISGTSWSYSVAEARTDIGIAAGLVQVSLRLKSVRAGLDSWQSYVIPIGLDLGAADPDFASVVLLMHMDGANASTTYVDSSALAHTISGNVPITTTNPRFGTGAALSAGDSKALVVPNNAAFNFGADDFTIEGFFARSSAISSPREILSKGSSIAAADLSFRVFTDLENFAAVVSLGSSTLTLFHSTFMVNDTYFHWAVVRSGDVISLYIQGNRRDTRAITGSINATSAPIRLFEPAYATVCAAGRLDELRISRSARYVGETYTVPTAAFPNG